VTAERWPRIANIVFFWDYDTQWGADRSRNPHRAPTWGPLEFPNTELILEAHARYDIPACFAVVGAAALPGERPYHDPAQIRRIHEAGHEVGSHSFRHEWLPALGGDGLVETLRSSKDALEQCIGDEVSTFVPPYNQPFDHLRGWSVSLSERRAVPHDRIDVVRLCDALVETGYAFSRLSYRSIATRLVEAVRGTELHRPFALERVSGIQTLRINTPCGFSKEARRAIEAQLAKGGYWVLYGHPHSATDEGSAQSLENLLETLRVVDGWRRAGRARCILPRHLRAPSQVT
jgi:peptidoglycan/xylan/chitin deacetylase (PgdA/CDA1 family)